MTPQEEQAEFEKAMQSGLYTYGEVLFAVITRKDKGDQDQGIESPVSIEEEQIG